MIGGRPPPDRGRRMTAGTSPLLISWSAQRGAMTAAFVADGRASTPGRREARRFGGTSAARAAGSGCPTTQWPGGRSRRSGRRAPTWTPRSATGGAQAFLGTPEMVAYLLRHSRLRLEGTARTDYYPEQPGEEAAASAGIYGPDARSPARRARADALRHAVRARAHDRRGEAARPIRAQAAIPAAGREGVSQNGVGSVDGRPAALHGTGTRRPASAVAARGGRSRLARHARAAAQVGTGASSRRRAKESRSAFARSGASCWPLAASPATRRCAITTSGRRSARVDLAGFGDGDTIRIGMGAARRST
jgi:hypothetical protein